MGGSDRGCILGVEKNKCGVFQKGKHNLMLWVFIIEQCLDPPTSGRD